MATFEEQYRKYSTIGQGQAVSIICDRRKNENRTGTCGICYCPAWAALLVRHLRADGEYGMTTKANTTMHLI